MVEGAGRFEAEGASHGASLPRKYHITDVIPLMRSTRLCLAPLIDSIYNTTLNFNGASLLAIRSGICE